MSNVDQAQKVFEQAEEHAKRYEARALEGLAHLALARGWLTEAKRYWERAIQLYPRDMADAEYARRYLAARDDRTATCFRCAIVVGRSGR